MLALYRFTKLRKRNESCNCSLAVPKSLRGNDFLYAAIIFTPAALLLATNESNVAKEESDRKKNPRPFYAGRRNVSGIGLYTGTSPVITIRHPHRAAPIILSKVWRWA